MREEWCGGNSEGEGYTVEGVQPNVLIQHPTEGTVLFKAYLVLTYVFLGKLHILMDFGSQF